MSAGERFIEARDQLLRWREDLSTAQREFRWPRFEFFNWALDYFDVIAADSQSTALRVVDDAGGEESLSFAELSRRSSQLASFLTAQGLGPGDRKSTRLNSSHSQ